MSRFCFSRPPDVTWSVAASGPGGTGQAIISPVGAAGTNNLFDGRPDTTCRFQWPTGASQTTSTIMRIRADWTATQIAPLLSWISNISLPVGTKITLALRRASDTLGTYPYTTFTAYNNGQRIVGNPRGERVCGIFLPLGGSVGTILGAEWQISNDVNGSASIAPGTLFNIGELAIAPGADLDIAAGWSLRTIDPTINDTDANENPIPEPGVPYRQFAFSLPVDEQKIYFGDPSNPTATDYEELFAFLDRGQYAIYAPRFLDDVGAFDAQAAHRFTFIGRATSLPSWDQASGKFWQNRTGATVREAPIPT
jgi:hypothetical protein